MSETVIRVENLSKRYRIGTQQQPETFAQQIRHSLSYPWRNFKRLANLTNFGEEDDESIFWALRDINFEVKKGEVLGIIGHNGAGKSTLLKILSRITEPTSGQVAIKGRVSALLEVGTGFHPELTGKDNIYMNGTILGMTKKEIDAKYDEIVAFSGVEKHIYTPVKFYSSGMKVRLAFSVAAHLEPEILVIDEVLAVGDADFQKKCLGKMESVASQGRTVLFVSHNMAAVEGLCSKALQLQDGAIKFVGNTEDTIRKYLSFSKSNEKTDLLEINNNKYIHLQNVILRSTNGDNVIRSGHNIEISFRYEIKPGQLINDLSISYHIYDLKGNRLLVCNPKFTLQEFRNINKNGMISLIIPHLPLTPNIYIIGIWMRLNYDLVLKEDEFMRFEVSSGDFYRSSYIPKNNPLFYVDQKWQMTTYD